MKIIISKLIFGSVLLNLSFAGAQGTCVNDKSGKKKAANQSINRSVTEARDPFTLAAIASIDMASFEGAGTCVSCSEEKHKDEMPNVGLNVRDFVSKIKGVASIKKDCVVSALQRSIGSTGYSCYSKDKGYFKNSGATTPCLNKTTVNYVHYAVNEAISCLSSVTKTPIDSRYILKKLNNESGFNFFIAYDGGKGIGQLTSDATKEMSIFWYKGKKQVPGNSHYFLRDVMESSDPSCSSFQVLLKEDLAKPAPLPSSSNVCAWVSPGIGLARNLIYSLSYYLFLRDRVIARMKKAKLIKLMQNSDIVNYFTLVSYSAGGEAASKALSSDLRVHDNMNQTELLKRIRESNDYVRATEKKFEELVREYRPDGAVAADYRGDTCLE